MEVEIREESAGALAEHGAVEAAFTVERIYHVGRSRTGAPVLHERRVAEPWRKDYDAVPGNRPADWAGRFDVSGWTGILVPTGTPDAIVARLHKEIAAAVALPDVQQKFLSMGVEPVSNTPSEFAAMLARDTARYAAVARTAGIEKQ